MELRRLSDHLRTPQRRASHALNNTAANARLHRLQNRQSLKDVNPSVDPAFLWDMEGFGDATKDWIQDEWEHLGLFMDAMNDRQEVASNMNEMQERNARQTEVYEIKRAVVRSRKFLGPDLIMHGRVKRNGRKHTFTWNQYEFFIAKHWTSLEWSGFVKCVHEIIDASI